MEAEVLCYLRALEAAWGFSVRMVSRSVSRLMKEMASCLRQTCLWIFLASTNSCFAFALFSSVVSGFSEVLCQKLCASCFFLELAVISGWREVCFRLGSLVRSTVRFVAFAAAVSASLVACKATENETGEGFFQFAWISTRVGDIKFLRPYYFMLVV